MPRLAGFILTLADTGYLKTNHCLNFSIFAPFKQHYTDRHIAIF